MRYVNCDLCGADDFKVVFPEGVAQLHRIVRCNRCGLMYANPQEVVDCDRVRSDAHYRSIDEVRDRLYFRKQQVQLPDNLRALRRLDQLLPSRGRLLEIGSFCGFFLDQIRADGWDATGLEPDPAAAEYSRTKFGLNIVGSVLPAPELPDHAFDAVVMLHVIEHMPEPSADLRAIHRVLKPGGVLVVETPRFDSLSFKLLGRRERSLSNCNGHIYFFTTTTLRRLLEKAGFEVERTELVGRTLTLERLCFNIGLVLRHERIKQWLGRTAERLNLDRFRLYLNVRDMQRIYCRAKETRCSSAGPVHNAPIRDAGKATASAG